VAGAAVDVFFLRRGRVDRVAGVRCLLGQFGIFLLVAVTAGCSATAFRESADRQVYGLLAERVPRVLEYTPEVVAGPAEGVASIEPRRGAYLPIPETRIVADAPTPLEPVDFAVPPGPLGPPVPVADGSFSAEVLLLELRAAERRFEGELSLGPPTPEMEAGLLKIGLFDGIRAAVVGNRGYRGQMENLYLSALEVTLERHLFTPRPFVGADLTARRSAVPGGATGPDYNAALTAVTFAGVRQRLPAGGEIVAEATADFVDALDGNVQEGESAELAIRASIPLLRGAGLVNLESLIDAERDLIYQIRSFERFRRGFVVDAARRYFNLRASKSRVRNRFRRYLSALQLVDRSINLFAADELTALEVQRARQQALQSEDSLNQAEQAYARSLDDFKLFLGLDPRVPVELVDVSLVMPEVDVPPEVLLRAGLTYRLDLQTTRDRVADAQRALANSRNALLPDLDLTARAALQNESGDPAARITGDRGSIQAGLSLDLPVDRLRERNALRRSLINLERATRAVEEAEDRVVIDVRDALRRLDTALTTLRIQQENIAVAADRLELADQLLQTGRSNNSRNVVEAQNALLAALDAFEQAQANYQIAVLNLLLATGTLRVDPDAGSLGRAAWRAASTTVDARGIEPDPDVSEPGMDAGMSRQE
jgi:outer membrane protein TolC